jgi:hypothetical protein
MNMIIWKVIGFFCVVGFSSNLVAQKITAQDLQAAQLPLPRRVEEMLAKVQARAAMQMESNRLQSKPTQNPLAALITPQNDALRGGDVRVHQSTMDNLANDVLGQRHTQGPFVTQPITSFVMRSDGQSLESSSFNRSFGQASKLVQEIRGCIKIDRDEEDVPPFKVYFEGMETTNNSDGFFSFPVEKANIDKYAIIICNKIKYTFSRHNTVDVFGLIADMNYRYYRFRRNHDGSGKWVQCEKDLRKKNLQIPHNAIVVTLNPAYFERIEETWPGDFGSGVLKLPRIVFKEGKRAKLERKSVKSLLYGLDMSPFHTNVKHASKDIENGKGEILVTTQR